MTKTSLTVAEIKTLTLAAADLRQDSYDKATGCYHLDESEAAELACKVADINPELAQLIGLSLSGWWSDVLVWAGDFDGRVPAITLAEAYGRTDPIVVR